MLPGVVRVIRWHKSTGDAVRGGDVICEIEVENVSVEVTAWRDGILGRLVDDGGEVKSANSLAIIYEKGETSSP